MQSDIKIKTSNIKCCIWICSQRYQYHKPEVSSVSRR